MNIFPQGLFITLEGLESSGKTTQAPLLKEWFEEQGYEVVLTREPGGTAYGTKARELFLGNHRTMTPEAEVGLLLTCKAQLLDEVIRPSLMQGKVVICDRYTDTLYAYQHGAKGHSRDMIDNMVKAFNCHLDPDLALLYYIDAQTSIRRSLARRDAGGEFTDLDAETLDFHHRVGSGLISNMMRRPDNSYAVIPADRSSIEEVLLASTRAIEESMYRLQRERAPAVAKAA